MRRFILAIGLVLLLLSGIVLQRQHAASVAIPYCDEVKNEHYSGPCIATMINGVITGDD